MIERYASQEMTRIWSDENRFRLWQEVETVVCEVRADRGEIPAEAAREIRAKGAVETARVLEIERTVQHDVIACLTNMAEHIGPASRFVHQGMTSSDVLDTCFNIQLTRAADIPLAAEVIEQGGHAINPRGEQYSPETIGARLNMRDFMDTLRASGIQSGGPPPLGQRERQDFANSLDRLLTRYLRESGRR